MPAGTASWEFTQDDFGAISESLKSFLAQTRANSALLVDRSGQLILTVGETGGMDGTTFATLTAADFSANEQLARLLGETDFSSLFHQGDRESVFVADVARKLILVIVFDSRTTVGLVRLHSKAEVENLTVLVDRVLSRSRNGAGDSPLLKGAEAEIDELFNW